MTSVKESQRAIKPAKFLAESAAKTLRLYESKLSRADILDRYGLFWSDLLEFFLYGVEVTLTDGRKLIRPDVEFAWQLMDKGHVNLAYDINRNDHIVLLIDPDGKIAKVLYEEDD